VDEQTSLFDWTTLLFELYSHKHHVASSSSENQKAGWDFQAPLFEKGWTTIQEKFTFYCT
jgi:hypothetical protein